MGHNNSKHRLNTIKENVEHIANKIGSGRVAINDKDRYNRVLFDYSQELRLILSKNVRPAKISKVQNRINIALRSLEMLENNHSVQYIQPKKNDIKYQQKLKLQSLQELEEIKKNVAIINQKLQPYNFEDEKRAFYKAKRHFNSIDNFDMDLRIKKMEVQNVISRTESAVQQLEVEEKLRRIEQKHFQSRVDVNRFTGVFASDSYIEHKGHLIQLENDICHIVPESNKEQIEDKKRYILYNLNNNISCLDQKVQENQEKLNQRIAENGALVDPTPSSPNQGLLIDLVASYNQFENLFSTNCSLRELHEVFSQLREMKSKISQNLKQLEDQIILRNENYQYEPPEREFQDFVDSNQVENIVEDPYVHLVMQRTDAEAAENPMIKNRIEEIQREVENIHLQIFNSTFSKDSHVYFDFKSKLRGCRIELVNMSHGNEDNRNLKEHVIQYINDILKLLEGNLPIRTSTTDAVLIDIMSVSSSVNELADKMQNLDNTSDDYDLIENDLREHLHYLKELPISAARNNVCKFRDYVVIQIESLLSNVGKYNNKNWYY